MLQSSAIYDVRKKITIYFSEKHTKLVNIMYEPKAELLNVEVSSIYRYLCALETCIDLRSNALTQSIIG